MRSSRAALVAVLIATAVSAFACGDGDDNGAAGTTSDGSSTTSTTSFEERTHDTWRDGDDRLGSVSKVVGIIRRGDPPACTRIEVEGGRQAVTWPPGSSRSDEGVAVGNHLYRFDQEDEFSVIKDYDGPQRVVTCLTVRAWLVTR